MQNPNSSVAKFGFIASGFIEWRTQQDTSNQALPNQITQPQPYSTQFQDVYYSSDNGLLETDYVFLQGNQLASRFQQLENSTFTIIETGFGTGLNFLCAVQLWLTHAHKDATLHFISTEKYPLNLQEITQALQFWSELSDISAQFLAQYSTLSTQNKTISLFDHRVHLTLFIGDATESLVTLDQTADAWFLDGFSPAKNPKMWQPALFTQMARLSNPTSTFATFTSAGVVKRGLQTAGFQVNKQAGFGKKREMLTGYFTGDSTSNNHQSESASER